MKLLWTIIHVSQSFCPANNLLVLAKYVSPTGYFVRDNSCKYGQEEVNKRRLSLKSGPNHTFIFRGNCFILRIAASMAVCWRFEEEVP